MSVSSSGHVVLANCVNTSLTSQLIYYPDGVGSTATPNTIIVSDSSSNWASWEGTPLMVSSPALGSWTVDIPASRKFQQGPGGTVQHTAGAGGIFTWNCLGQALSNNLVINQSAKCSQVYICDASIPAPASTTTAPTTTALTTALTTTSTTSTISSEGVTATISLKTQSSAAANSDTPLGTVPTSAASTQTTAVSGPTSTANENPNNPGNNGSNGLNVGSQVGSIVGAIAGVIAIVVPVFLYWRKRKHAQKQAVLPISSWVPVE